MSSVALTTCGSCGASTPAGKKFCIHCGSPVVQSCPTCGEPVIAGARELDASKWLDQIDHEFQAVA